MVFVPSAWVSLSVPTSFSGSYLYATHCAVGKLPFSSYSDCLLTNYQEGHQNRLVSFNLENVWRINIVVSGLMRNNASKIKKVSIL